MKKIIALLFFMFFINFNFIFANEDKIILIDPGHGGRDGGAESKRKTIEKEINLKIGLKLKDKLKDKYTVVMTREGDISLHKEGTKHKKQQDLNSRRKMIDDSNCDLFVSIHLNKFDSPNVQGSQVYYANNDKSKIFADILNENYAMITGGKKRVPKANKEYVILKNIESVPSVIFECGFITNAEEDEKLNTDEYQNVLADVIEKSIDDYFSKLSTLDKNNSTTNIINSTEY